jgi:hypothetical protein
MMKCAGIDGCDGHQIVFFENDAQKTCRNLQVLGFLGPLWEWKHRWTPAAEVRKILFVEKRRERLNGGIQGDLETSGPVGQVGDWVL